MSRFDDYESEMKTRFSDRDIERLLTGGNPDSREAADLAPLLEMLKASASYEPSQADTQRYAAEAAEIARLESMRSGGAAEPSNVRAHRRRGWLASSPRFGTALAAVLLLVGMTGVAFASNGAAPGDSLYGIDRALENVGLGAGGLGERLLEAGALVNHGRSAEALAHAAEALDASGGEDEDLTAAAAALHSAAQRLEAMDLDEMDVRSRVTVMLRWIAGTDLTAQDFDQGVSQLAREITGQSNPASDEKGNGPPVDVPAGNQGGRGS
jgi:hypothetical protein